MNQPKSLETVVVLILLFIQWTAAAQVVKGFDRLIKNGDALQRQFDMQGAYEAYKEAHRLLPGHYEALLKLTRASNDLGEEFWKKSRHQSKCYFRESVGYAELMHRQFPDSAETYISLAIAYGNLALFSGGKEKVKLARDVEAHCQKAIATNPNLGASYLVLGIYYREVANLNWLLKLFAKALYRGMPGGSNELSAEMLLMAIKQMPESIEAHLQLAQTYHKLKQYDKTLTHLKTVIELPVSDHMDPAKKAMAATLLTQWSTNISE